MLERLWLQQELGEDPVDAAIVAAGQESYRHSDGIDVIPAALFGR